MDLQRWRRIQGLFIEVAELAPEQREAHLDRAAAGDPELHREVRALLAADAEATSFLEGSALPGSTQRNVTRDAWLGRRFGAYQATAELGRGGMATVLLGERADGRYRGRVAIKILQASAARGDLVARFRTEGQILADLDHPNIARLLDAGDTDDGLSYLLMEYVDGLRLDAFADDRRLDVPARLRLFREVLQGVEYAHDRGVVHRDLKPSNILVTADGRPKIVDFGIAKLLQADAPAEAATRTLHRLMTPEYASPEQVLGQPVARTSDVYSLGIVLYRLLTGRPPYALPTTRPGDAERVICEQDPRRPSDTFKQVPATTGSGSAPAPGTRDDPDELARTRSGTRERVLRSLRGDVDTIVLKALRKEPGQRYGTAAAFADDIAHHLAGRPITARSPSALDRTRRVLRRRGRALGVAALLLLALAGLGWQAGVAASERRRAESGSGEIARLAESFLASLDRLATTDQTSTASREALVSSTVASLDDLVQRLGGTPDPALLTTLGRAYAVAGGVQGSPSQPNLGKPEEARSSFTRAIELFERVLALGSAPPGTVLELAKARVLLADVLRGVGEREEALRLTERALPVFDSLAQAHPDSAHLAVAAALAHERRSGLRAMAGDVDGGMADLRSSIARLAALPAEGLTEAAGMRAHLNLLAARTQLSSMLTESNRLSEAGTVSEAAVRQADSLVAAAGAQPITLGYQADAYHGLAWQRFRSRQFADAHRIFSRQLEILARLAEVDPDNAQTPLRTALSHEARGQTALFAKDWTAALEDQRAAIDLLTPLLPRSPPLMGTLMQAHRGAGEALTGLGRFAEAEPHLRLAAEQARTFMEANPDLPAASAAVAAAYSSFETFYQWRARATGSAEADCPAAVAMGDTAHAYVTRARTGGGMLPAFEEVWREFETRKARDACQAHYARAGRPAA